MDECWKDIEGFPGYQISNCGRLRSFWKRTHYPTGFGCFWELGSEPKLMRLSDDGNGYLKAMLYCKADGKRYCKKIHRLVAEAFIPRPSEEYDTVDHIKPGRDGKRDNSVENLRWISRRENIQKAYQDGVCENRILMQRKAIIARNLDTEEILVFASIQDASEELKIDRSTISHILCGDITKTKNWTFEYLGEGGIVEIINSFPGYQFVRGEDGKMHNMFRGEDVGFGGYVYSRPGMYGRTTVLDVSGMHPASIIAMRYFGDYTDRFKEIVDLRLAIKHKDYEKARHMLGGEVAEYLNDESTAKALSNALKIVVNSCYGQTSASYDNIMRDKRNVNNIVALRGALFMVTLRDEVLSRGFNVIGIKTDSIKVENADDELIQFVKDFGLKYGYTFEIENIFEKICLVNDSTFIAKCAEDDPSMPGQWYAKAVQFQVPYVFKTLFSHEPIEFKDLCEIKTVQTALYLDLNEQLPDGSMFEKELAIRMYNQLHSEDADFKPKKQNPNLSGYSIQDLRNEIDKCHDYHFVGKVGQFCPMKPGSGGGVLLRETDEGFAAATGTKGYRWMESEIVRTLGKEKDIDHSYYRAMVDEAIASISKYGDFEEFAS